MQYGGNHSVLAVKNNQEVRLHVLRNIQVFYENYRTVSARETENKLTQKS